MPVSPQDFALWSRMTGNPYPQTPAERMALAPHVYEYTRQIGRQGGPTMGPVRRAVDVVGKAALGAGLLAGAAYLGGEFGKYLRPGESTTEVEEVEAPATEPEAVTETPTPKDFLSRRTAGISKYAAARGGIQSGLQSQMQLELDNESDIGSTVAEALPDVNSQVARASGDITKGDTATNYNQRYSENQSSLTQALRGVGPDKPTAGPIEEKPANQSEVITTSQHFSPGTEEQQLARIVQPSPSVREQAERLIDSVTGGVQAEREETRATVVPGPVSPTPKTKIVTSVTEESPIAEMSSVPVAVAPVAPRRQSAEQMEDERLARLAFGNMPLDQAMGLLASARAAKGSKTVGTPAESMTVVAEPQPTTRVVTPVTVNPPGPTISPNKFLSEMSQQVGPVATYKVSQERSPAVKEISFYPGGEMGVQMRRGGMGEYAFATSDPYRIAMSDYAEEGFPTGMGKIGGIVSKAGTAAQLGLQKAVEPGGIISENQPRYTGLMDSREIAKKLASKSQRTREQAAYHAGTRDVLEDIETRNPQSPLDPREISRFAKERAEMRLASQQKYGI